MSIIRFSVLLTLWVGLLLVAGACGKPRTSADPAQQAKAFQSASPQTQSSWQLAVDAATTNDYATAVLTLRKLQAQPDLTPEQRTAVNDRMTAVNTQLAAALEKGDPNATKAIQEIKQRGRSR
jgi:hypothetical protein